MKNLNLLVLLLTCFTLLIACADPEYVSASDAADLEEEVLTDARCTFKFSSENLCLRWQWERLPTETEAGSFIFQVFKLDQQGKMVLADPVKQPTVILWMPSMGHGSSPVTVTRTSIGVYLASAVFFVMPGEWDIRINLDENGKTVDQITVPFTL